MARIESQSNEQQRQMLTRRAFVSGLSLTVCGLIISHYTNKVFGDELKSDTQKQLENVQAEYDAAMREFQNIGRELETADYNLTKCEESLANLEIAISNIEAEITEKQLELSEAQDILASRIRANYKAGNADILGVIMESTNFDDFVSRVHYADKASEADANAIREVQTLKESLEAQEAFLLEQREDQKALLEDQQAYSRELEASVSYYENYTASLSNDVVNLIEQNKREEAAAQQEEYERYLASLPRTQSSSAAQDAANTSQNSQSNAGQQSRVEEPQEQQTIAQPEPQNNNDAPQTTADNTDTSVIENQQSENSQTVPVEEQYVEPQEHETGFSEIPEEIYVPEQETEQQQNVELPFEDIAQAEPEPVQQEPAPAPEPEPEPVTEPEPIAEEPYEFIEDSHPHEDQILDSDVSGWALVVAEPEPVLEDQNNANEDYDNNENPGDASDEQTPGEDYYETEHEEPQEEEPVYTGNGHHVPGAVGVAYSCLGIPYEWGGTTTDGFDCSGLVQYCYACCGYSISRTTYTQIAEIQALGNWVTSVNLLEPGDLVFPHEGHVQIYIGGGQVIHAPYPGTVIQVDTIYGFMGGGCPV
ncbi:MAG: C40 family peptidase [Coriobacteriales bacterium]|nr:C40 family peptidase [Coriobacteriales bacterium]